MLHIRDEEVSQMARRLAQLRKETMTDAVRHALLIAIEQMKPQPSLWEKTADIREDVARYGKRDVLDVAPIDEGDD